MQDWFRHDNCARQDQKLLKLKVRCGMEGIGIWWCIAEMLSEADEHRLLYDLEIIAEGLSVAQPMLKRCLEQMIMAELLTVESDGDMQYVFSVGLRKRLADLDNKRRKYIEAGRLGGQASVKRRSSDAQARVNHIDKKILDKKIYNADDPLSPVKVTDKEIESLIKRLGEAQYLSLRSDLEAYAETKPALFKQYKNHSRVISQWAKLRRENGYVWGVGPEGIEGFYKSHLIKGSTNVRREATTSNGNNGSGQDFGGMVDLGKLDNAPRIQGRG